MAQDTIVKVTVGEAAFELPEYILGGLLAMAYNGCSERAVRSDSDGDVTSARIWRARREAADLIGRAVLRAAGA